MLPSIVPGKENVSNFVFLWWISVGVTNMKLHEEQNMICWVTFFIKDSTEACIWDGHVFDMYENTRSFQNKKI